jgi:hypothetical protein
MPSYSSLTVVSGTTITTAWGNNARDSMIPTTLAASRPTSPHEGYVTAVTDKDRLEISDASGNWLRGPAWAETGRTGSHGQFINQTHFISGVWERIQLSAATFDSDGNINNGADSYTIPLAGLWAVTLHVAYSAGFSASNHFCRIAIAGRDNFDFRGSPANANASGCIVQPLVVGEVITFHSYQDSGGSVGVTTGSTWSCYMLSP